MRAWSCDKPAEWCQRTSVQLQGEDGVVTGLNLEEAMPEGKSRSLPGLELKTAMERVIISFS